MSKQSQLARDRHDDSGYANSSKRGLISSDKGGPTAKKVAPDTEDSFEVTKTFKVTTNMIPLHVSNMKQVQRIKVETFVVSSGDQKVQLDLPETVVNDVSTNNDRLRQLTIMTSIPYLKPEFFPKQRDFVFDSTTLYIPNGQYIGGKAEEIRICENLFENVSGFWKQKIARFLRNDDDEFLVRLTHDGYIPQGIKALEPAHRSELLKFLRILTSQKSNKDMYYHKGYLTYSLDSKQNQSDSAMNIRPGFSKSIAINGESAEVTMSINTQCSAFYTTLPILTLVSNMHKEFKNEVSNNSIDETEKSLKDDEEFSRIVRKELIGLYVKATHLKEGANTLQIVGLSKNNAENEFIMLEDHSVTIAEFFLKVYNTPLQHPKMRLIIGMLYGEKCVFPMEVLKIAQYQLKHSMSMKEKKKYEKASELSSAPDYYMYDVAAILRGPLELTNSPLMNAFGIEYRFNAPLFSQAKLLSRPDIKIRAEVKRLHLGCSEIPQTGSFEQPATVHQAAVISFDKVLSKTEIRDLAVRLEEICLKKGIKIGSKFCAHEMSAKDYMWMDQSMMGWNNQKVGIVIGIVENEKSDVYDALKYYRISKVQTILLTKKTVDQIVNDNKETINKVTRKINMKCGGINFLINIPKTIDGKESALHKKLRASVQYIGIKTYQSIDLKNQRMTMIGASFNESTSSRLNGHCYQEMHHNRKIQTIDSILLEGLESYKKRSKQYPATVVLYRSICNIEDFDNVKEEIEEIRESFVGRTDGYSPSLVVLAVQEDALVRMFVPANDLNGPNTNVRPGTYIDTRIISHGYDEFILNSHTPTRGVSVPARYTILANDPSWTKNEISHITWFMTFNNQVGYKPHAVVDVLHFAGKLAKRGTDIHRFGQNILPNDA